MNDKKGVIYILTNPSFPDYVKIGYADDIDKRLKQLNRSECIPFAFRVYATYEVNSRLSDLKLHAIIDTFLKAKASHLPLGTKGALLYRLFHSGMYVLRR